MTAIDNFQIKQIHTLLPAEIKESKEAKGDLISQFTADPDKRSTRDLSFDQANELIKQLGGNVSGESEDAKFAAFDKYNNQHQYMLSICYQLGWVTYNEKQRRQVVDLSRLGVWLRKYGFKHKPLMKYNKSELPVLVSQFEKLLNR